MGSRVPRTTAVVVLLGALPGGCGLFLGDALDVTLAPDAGLVEGGRADDADTPSLDAGAEARDDATPADASSADAASDAGADSTPEAGDGGGCDGGPCVLADDQLGATLVIVDDANIYFNTQDATNNNIYQCPKSGCQGSPLQLGTGMNTGLAVDATYVYWGDYNGGTLQACTIGGCNMNPITVSAAEPYIEAVISDGTTLFWTTQGHIRACTLPCNGSAGHAPRSIGNPVANPPLITELAVDQGNVFWVPGGTTSIYGCDATSCASPIPLAQGVGGMFASRRVLYFVGTSNAVEACAEAGCAQSPQTIGSSRSPALVVSDGINVYWRDQRSYDILKCPTTGCTGGGATYIAKQYGDTYGGRMALDGQNIYWCTTRQVLSFPK